MANEKITQFPQGGNVQPTDIVWIVRNGIDYQGNPVIGVTQVSSVNTDIEVENPTTTPQLTLNSSVNGVANKIVKFNSLGQLGTVDVGTNATVLDPTTSVQTILNNTLANMLTYARNADNINAGTLANARLSSSVTLAGNDFNGASQLVQLDSDGYLPVLNGSALTGLTKEQVGLGNVKNVDQTNADNITSGTLSDDRLSDNVATKQYVTDNTVSSIGKDTQVSGQITLTGPGVVQNGNTFNFPSSADGGATALIVQSSNNTIQQIGDSTYNDATKTITVDLQAIGDGSGTVTNVSSVNADIGVTNETTTPVLTLNSTVDGGSTNAGKVLKLDSDGNMGDVNVGLNAVALNPKTITLTSVNQALQDIYGSIPQPYSLPIATTSQLGGSFYPVAGALTVNAQGAVGVNVDDTTIKIVNNKLQAQLPSSTLDGITQATTPFLTSLGGSANKTATGLNNTFIGTNAGKAVTTGANNTAVGTDAIATLTTGAYNTAIGDGAGQLMTIGSNNTILGQDAMKSSVNVSSNTVIGAQAGEILSGSNNVIVGFQSGDLFTNPANVVCVGAQAGGGWTSGASGTVAIGYGSLNNLTSGANNCAVGFQSGSNITTGTNNTAIGQSAMRGVSATNNNTAVGFSALNASTGAHNTALGAYAGDKATTGGNSVFIGSTAGTGVTTGDGNTFIGASAGSAVTTGSNNTLIGRYTGNATLFNTVALSDGAGGLKLFINNSNAWGLGAAVAFGLENQVITSGGSSSTAASWTYKNSNVIQSITANTTVTAGKAVTFVNATNNNVDVTIPSANGNTGLNLTIKRTDSSSNTVTIISAGGTIEGLSSKTLSALATITLTSNGTNWFITSTNESSAPPAAGGTYAIADGYLLTQSLSTSGQINFNQATNKAVNGCTINDTGIVLLPNRTYQFNMMLPVTTAGQPEINSFTLQYTGNTTTPPTYALTVDTMNVVRGTIDNNVFTANANDGQVQSKGYAISGALTQYTPQAMIFPMQACVATVSTTPTQWSFYTRIGVPDTILYKSGSSINFLTGASKASFGSADLGTNTQAWMAFTNPVGPSGTYFNCGGVVNDKYSVLFFNGNQASVYFQAFGAGSWTATPAQATQVSCNLTQTGLSANMFLTFATNKTGYRFNLDNNTALELTLPNENTTVFLRGVANGYIGANIGFAIANNAASTWDTIYTLVNNSNTINSVVTNIKAVVPQATQMGGIVYNPMDKYWYCIVWDYDNNNSYFLRSNAINDVTSWGLIQTINGTLYGSLTYSNTRGVNLNGYMMVATKVSKSGVEPNTTVCSVNGGQFNAIITNDLTLRGVIPVAHPSGVMVLSSSESTQSYKFTYDGITWQNGTAFSNVSGHMVPTLLGFCRITANNSWTYITSAVYTIVYNVALNLIPDAIWLGGQYLTSVFGSSAQHQITSYTQSGNGMVAATNPIAIPGNNTSTNIQIGVAGLNVSEQANNVYATMFTIVNGVRLTANTSAGSTLTTTPQYAIAQNDRILLSGLVVTGSNSATLSVSYDFAINPVQVLTNATMSVTEV